MTGCKNLWIEASFGLVFFLPVLHSIVWSWLSNQESRSQVKTLVVLVFLWLNCLLLRSKRLACESAWTYFICLAMCGLFPVLVFVSRPAFHSYSPLGLGHEASTSRDNMLKKEYRLFQGRESPGSQPSMKSGKSTSQKERCKQCVLGYHVPRKHMCQLKFFCMQRSPGKKLIWWNLIKPCESY